MKTAIRGKFGVKPVPEVLDETSAKIGVMRMKFDKVFEGPLAAQETVAMIGAMDKTPGSGGYVALERIHESSEGKHGRFLLQHARMMESR